MVTLLVKEGMITMSEGRIGMIILSGRVLGEGYDYLSSRVGMERAMVHLSSGGRVWIPVRGHGDEVGRLIDPSPP